MTACVMRSVVQLLARFRADQNGATAIEYALIAAGVGATIASTVFGLGTNLQESWYNKIAGIFQ